jgi:hypothetical protein
VTESTVGFTTDFSSAVNYPDLDSVGRVYEVGINGVGYMLADDPQDPDRRYRRVTQPLEAQRFYSSVEAFNETIIHYHFVGWDDWTAGAGQTWYQRDNSSNSRYLDSDGVNPFEPFQLTLLPATAVAAATAYATPRAVVVGSVLYMQTGDKQLTAFATPGGAGTAFTIAAATTITDLTTDGQYWYAAAGAQGVFRGSTAADPGAAWSTVAATVISFAGGRVCAAYASSGSAPNRFTTLNDAGAEEVAGGRLTAQPGATLTKAVGGSGHAWFGAYSGNAGVVYRWNLGTDTPAVALEVPPGEVPKALAWDQGNVMVRTDSVGGTAKGRVYRCVVDATGSLSSFLVFDTIATPGSEPAFAANSRFVFCSWPSMDGTHSGVGALDLSTGGYTKWLKAAAGGSVRSIVMWQGKLGFVVDGVGLCYEQGTYVTSGWLTTSIADHKSNLTKVYDEVAIWCKPLVTGESVALDYTLNASSTYAAFTAATLDTPGLTRKTTALDKQGVSIGLRITLNGPGTSTPAVSLSQVRSHLIGIADTLVQLPVNCADEISGLNNRPLPENGKGKGAQRARALEGLIQTRVRFQDIDWATTKTSEVWDCVNVEVPSTAAHDRSTGKNRLLQVAIVTLRKRAK